MFYFWLLHRCAYLFYRIYGRARAIGVQNVPKSGGVIVASNHLSYLDPPLIGCFIPRVSSYMARHDLWSNKALGWFITRTNAFPVHRETADRGAIKEAVARLKRGDVLVLFPEGTRSPDGNLQKAEAGVALIVSMSGAPVVPTALIGPEVMWPPGQKKLRRADIKVVYGEPITFERGASREQIVGTIMAEIARLLTENGRPMRSMESIEAGGA